MKSLAFNGLVKTTNTNVYKRGKFSMSKDFLYNYGIDKTTFKMVTDQRQLVLCVC